AAQVLHSHHRICHHILHFCVVRLCNITIQALTLADGAVCRADHWLSTSLHYQPALFQVKKESKEDHGRPLPPWTHTFFQRLPSQGSEVES
ncbi:hypothetical protein LDENG_00177110, partial [Lucifuga dentata]